MGKLDRLLILNPVDYRLSKQWRIQAEHDMIKTGKSGMTDVEISQFVDYFWKALHPELFINSLMENPEFVDLIIEINPDHSIGNVYQVNLWLPPRLDPPKSPFPMRITQINIESSFNTKLVRYNLEYWDGIWKIANSQVMS